MTKRMTRLEYARAISAVFGTNAPVTWLTVGELVELLEELEASRKDKLDHLIVVARTKKEVVLTGITPGIEERFAGRPPASKASQRSKSDAHRYPDEKEIGGTPDVTHTART